MLEIQKPKNNIFNTVLDKDSTTDDSSEGSFSFIEYKPKIIHKSCKVFKRKQKDICYALDLFDKNGSIFVQELNTNNFFISKIRKIEFPECRDLFEKGKKDLTNYYNEAIETIPNLTFWHQRYYYYKLFDEGIKMDYESKNIIIYKKINI